MRKLREIAKRMSASVGAGEEGENLLVTMSPQIDKWLESCGPPDMTKVHEEKPDDCDDQDWIDAVKIQQNSMKASAGDTRKFGRQIHRHSEEKMDRTKCQTLGVDLIHEAQTQTLAEIAEARKEAREQG